MIEAQNLSVSYGRHVALADISIKLERGSITVVLGANGAGKTTLVHALAGLVSPSAGRILLDGRDITGLPPHRRVGLRLSTVPQGRGLFPDMSVADNLALGGFVTRDAHELADRRAAVYRLFPRLAERRKQAAETMSGGEQQMLAIGRALMAKPAYLLLDEPSLGLSPVLVSELFRTVRMIADRGVGVLLVEQNALQSLKIGERAYLVETGRIIDEGPAAGLRYDAAVIETYLGGRKPPADAAAKAQATSATATKGR